MVAVYARRHRCAPQPTTHKLQQRHLRTRILHRHAIRLELEIRLPAYIPPIIRVAQQRLLGTIEMRVQDLLGERQLALWAEHAAHFLEAGEELGVRRGALGEGDVVCGGWVVGGCERAVGGEEGEGEAWLVVS